MPAKAELKRVPKYHFAEYIGKLKNRIVQFAENVQLLRDRARHYR